MQLWTNSRIYVAGGSSNNPCGETFAGTKAFSEPETLSMSNFINTIADRMPFYVSLHSYGQWILIPFGHDNEKIPQYNTYVSVFKSFYKVSAKSFKKISTLSDENWSGCCRGACEEERNCLHTGKCCWFAV